MSRWGPIAGRSVCCLLELNGTDMRPMPLGERKAKLARLVDRRLTAIVMNDHTDASGELVFQQACRMGLEGICPSGSRSRTNRARHGIAEPHRSDSADGRASAGIEPKALIPQRLST
jgi:hypothetical protein